MPTQTFGHRLYLNLVTSPGYLPGPGDLCEFINPYADTDPHNNHDLRGIHHEYSYETILEILPATDDYPFRRYRTDTDCFWHCDDLVRVIRRKATP
jgi:hypothetical protein